MSETRSLTNEELQKAAFLTERILVILGTSNANSAILAVTVGACAGRLVTVFAKQSGQPIEDIAEGVLKQIAMGIEQAARVDR